MQSLSMSTPVGTITIQAVNDQIVSLGWTDGGKDETDVLKEAKAQIDAYFARRLEVFDLPLALVGGAYQDRFRQHLLAIPFGETRTYGNLAKDMDLSAQAVGQLCGGNPVPLVVPCHRILAADGLGGFSAPGGIETKVVLLRHEGAAGLLI